jgi:hypothetical protein
VVAYYGHYTFNEAQGTVTHYVEGSLFPNWTGQSMIRNTRFEDDTLELSTPPTRFGGADAIATLVWKIKQALYC